MENDFKEWADIVRDNRDGKNICFLSRGEWSDPDIAYKGKIFDYYDVYELCDIDEGDEPSIEEWVEALEEELYYGDEQDDFLICDVMDMYELKIINN